MSFIKRFSLYIIMILLLISINNDLTIGTFVQKKEKINTNLQQQIKQVNAILVRIQPGDTLLSKIEQINPDLPSNLDISKVIIDFRTLNPAADPHHLKADKSYLFPIY